MQNNSRFFLRENGNTFNPNRILHSKNEHVKGGLVKIFPKKTTKDKTLEYERVSLMLITKQKNQHPYYKVRRRKTNPP